MRTPRILIPALLFPAALQAGPGRIQAPDAAWKTLRTAHYRIHYPGNPAGGFEPFALEIASKIEGIHAKVTEWVGYEAKGPIEVVIQDPVLDANGMAVPLLKRPHVVLWKTPPESDSAIGHFTSWVDLLVVHELTHIHHMMRPQNQPNFWERLVDMPVGPVAEKAPRWVTEGYATVIEGRITGSGRPHGVYRSSVIRQWALQGKLPDYYAVSGMGGFRGGSMAYLVGSAYLEWLERQNPQDPDILKKFWKQLASKKRRPFDASFRATFGLSAQDGYDRWRAEVTHDALELERRAKAQGLIREGELVARFDGEVMDLAVSPDGTKLLGRVLGRTRPGLYVWDLAAKPEAKKAEAKTEKPDPNEVEDRKPEFQAPKTLQVIRRENGILPRHAWWSGKERITFERPQRNGEGVLEPDFCTVDLLSHRITEGKASGAPAKSDFNWKELDGTWNLVRTLPDGKELRLTRTLAAAWQPAPTPDGKAVYYVQLSAAGCEIRKLDLALPPVAEARLPVEEKALVPRTILSPADEANLLPAPVSAPPAGDYSAWDSHFTGSRSGFQAMPSAKAVQAGWGGNDLLGRLNWQVLGSFGSVAGPRGVAAGVAYRGWRWAPSLEAFSSLEQPSRQDFAPVAGFDRERRGGELAFTWQQQGDWPVSIRPLLAHEAVKGREPLATAVARSLAGAEIRVAQNRSWGEQYAVRWAALVQSASGRTDGQSWNLERADLSLGLRLGAPLGGIRLRASEGRLAGNPTNLDRFHLGGAATSMVPASLDWNRLEQVALPDYFQTGDHLRRFRGEIGGSWYVYLEHAAVWNQGQSQPHFQRVVGAEMPIHDLVPRNLAELLLGRFTFTLGIHRTLDGAMKDRTVGTATLVLRP
jgi:hypothetical protein